VVVSGLAPGDKVVTSGFGRLADGSRVRVLEQTGPGDAAPAPGGAPPAGARRGRGDKAAGAARP
jgi:multidrug efflux system membrane fusion protein